MRRARHRAPARGSRLRLALAAALLGTAAPWAAASVAVADETPSETPSEAPSEEPSETPSETPSEEPAPPPAPEGIGGFTSEGRAAPVRIEVYDPMIPLPTSPQVELSLGYAASSGDAGGKAARASLLWPGDALGTGAKTVFEQFGLPPELAEAGYPVQVNAASPGGSGQERLEPFPGVVQRAEADETAARGTIGFSPDGDVADGRERRDGDGDNGGSPLPGLPGATGSGGAGGTGSLLDQLGSAVDDVLGAPLRPRAAADPPVPSGPAVPGLPPELAALVDVEGFSSVSRLGTADGEAVQRTRSDLGRVDLLGGLVSTSGLSTEAVVSSDGGRPTAAGSTTYGDLVVLGQRFRVGPDGVEAVGAPTPIPGLPDQAGEALAALGVAVRLPAPEIVREGRSASVSAAGVVLDIDLAVLSARLPDLPLDDLVNELPLPPEAGPVKGVLGLLAASSSRVVITLGTASSAIEVADALPPPPAPDAPEAPEEEGEGEGSDGAAAGTGPGTPAAGAAPAPATTPGSTAPPAADGALTDAAPASGVPGLPPLFSIPGLLLIGALALAAVGGSYVRRLGLAALGGGAPCAHGLDSGLPDLRKA